MNVYSEIKEIIKYSLNKRFKYIETRLFDKITCEKPKEESHGDVASNVVLLILKHANLERDEIAEILIKDLKKNSLISDVYFQQPGFLNMKINNGYWLKLLSYINKNKEDYGFKNIGNGKHINLEFISANPTGPLHIGHVRGAVFGDVLGNLMEKNGYNVTKEYYVNDLGNQIDTLVKTIELHITNIKNKSEIKPNKTMYQGAYLKDMAKKIFNESPNILDAKNENILKNKSVNENIKLIKEDLKRLGIYFDIFTSEKELHEKGIVDEAINKLEKKELLYKGKLGKPKGIKDKDWVSSEQILFKSKNFGDDSDRAIKKNDGTWTYFASDIGYHYDKAKRGFDEIINIWGADHAGYIKRVSSAIKAFDFNALKFSVKLCQIVNIIDNNKILKMSKRAGNFILLKDVVESIGKDALRFFMLIRKNDAHLDFNLEKCLSETKENPIFYVQYANARINSIKNLMNNKKLFLDEKSSELLELINTKEEISIIKTLSLWPKIIETSVIYREPHRIVFYLVELASIFHMFWNMGKTNNDYRIVCEKNKQLTNARLILIEAVQAVLKSGLKILSIKPVEKM